LVLLPIDRRPFCVVVDGNDRHTGIGHCAALLGKIPTNADRLNQRHRRLSQIRAGFCAGFWPKMRFARSL
jgi:hypothetical protein